jgi:hypothetical protein
LIVDIDILVSEEDNSSLAHCGYSYQHWTRRTPFSLPTENGKISDLLVIMQDLTELHLGEFSSHDRSYVKGFIVVE